MGRVLGWMPYVWRCCLIRQLTTTNDTVFESVYIFCTAYIQYGQQMQNWVSFLKYGQFCHRAVCVLSVPPITDDDNRFRMSAADQRKLTERSSRFKVGLANANAEKKVSMEDLFKNAVSLCEVCAFSVFSPFCSC